MGKASFIGVAAGEQLGNLEYLIDDGALRKYRELVGSGGCYPNLIADDCMSVLIGRCGSLGLTTLWRKLEFLRPPAPGRRVQVGGWLKEAGERDGIPWVRVSTFAVDEIGTEILRAEAAFAIGRGTSPRARAGPPPTCAGETEGQESQTAVGSAFSLGSWSAPAGRAQEAYRRLRSALSGAQERCDGNGFTELTAGWLEGQLGRRLGDDFRWGGRLTVSHLRPVMAGDVVTGAVIVNRNDGRIDGGAEVSWIINAWNQRGECVAVGEARATIPSPRLL